MRNTLRLIDWIRGLCGYTTKWHELPRVSIVLGRIRAGSNHNGIKLNQVHLRCNYIQCIKFNGDGNYLFHAKAKKSGDKVIVRIQRNDKDWKLVVMFH